MQKKLVSFIIKLPPSPIVTFKSFILLFIFSLDDLSTGVSGMLKSLTIILLLSFSPFMSINICPTSTFLPFLPLWPYMFMWGFLPSP